MSKEFLRVLAQHQDDDVRLQVASNPDTPADALQNICAHDLCKQVREAAANTLSKVLNCK